MDLIYQKMINEIDYEKLLGSDGQGGCTPGFEESYLFDECIKKIRVPTSESTLEEKKCWLLLNFCFTYDKGDVGIGIEDLRQLSDMLGFPKPDRWFMYRTDFDNFMKSIEHCDFSKVPCTKISVPFSEHVISLLDQYDRITMPGLRKELILEKRAEIDSLEKYFRMYYGPYRDIGCTRDSCKRAVERYLVGYDVKRDNHLSIIAKLRYSRKDTTYQVRNPASIAEVVCDFLGFGYNKNGKFDNSVIGQVHERKEAYYRGYSFHSLTHDEMRHLVQFLEENGADFEYLYVRYLFRGH